MIRRLMLLGLALLLVTAFGAVQAQDSVSITIRCIASPPEELWRCNNFSEIEEQVEMDLGIDLELTLISGQPRLG